MRAADADLLLSRQFAHDLRSPMAALLILVTDLRQRAEGEDGAPPDPETLAMMEEALLAMDAMLVGLVSIASGSAGQRWGHEPEANTAPPVPFSLRTTLARVEALLAPWNRVRGGRLVWELEGEDLRLGHPELLAHLLFLLLVASLHPHAGGRESLHVSVRPTANAGEILFRIHSPGSLPPAETLEHLQQVVAGTHPRTRQCQAHLPLEGALWLARALGAEVRGAEVRGAEVLGAGDELHVALFLPPFTPAAPSAAPAPSV
jgi:signal transduction histidine kinase